MNVSPDEYAKLVKILRDIQNLDRAKAPARKIQNTASSGIVLLNKINRRHEHETKIHRHNRVEIWTGGCIEL